jgi:hypothetical protein
MQPRIDCQKCREYHDARRHKLFEWTEPTYGTWRFDVAHAMRILRDKPREPWWEVPVVAAAAWHLDFDPVHLDHVDMSIPGVCVNLPNAKLDGRESIVLIDGSHRCQRAVRDGLAQFWFYKLEDDERDAITLNSPSKNLTRQQEFAELLMRQLAAQGY